MISPRVSGHGLPSRGSLTGAGGQVHYRASETPESTGLTTFEPDTGPSVGRCGMPPVQGKAKPTFQPVRAVHAYERIVEQIEDAILVGRLAPNDRLPSERELMREFEVGRSTGREALRVLQSKGLVRSRPGDPHGPLVLPFSTDRLRDSMYALARFEVLSLRELLQFRMTIESSAFRLTALSRTSEQLAGLET